MPGIDRLIYVDDSYEEKHSGTIVFGWVEVDPDQWRVGLRSWLELRKLLFAEFTVPPSKELHGTDFINGRGSLVTDPAKLNPRFVAGDGSVLKKDVGRAIAERCLATIRDCPHLRVGAVYVTTTARGTHFASEKYALYERLVARLDHEHAERGTFATIAMDGDDPHFLDAHRTLRLDDRHIIEDPTMHDSKRSQWVQMADLIAYTAMTSLNRHHQNQFGWEWYATYLAQSDVNGGPLNLP